MVAHNAKDLAGQRFTRLVAIERVPGYGKRAMWLCRCDCGGSKIVWQYLLTKGDTRSCGCLQRETRAKQRPNKRTHGMSDTPVFRIWVQIRYRTLNPRCAAFKDYGGRGIGICDRWRDDFAAFNADMGKRPSANHTVERSDNDGPYSPENCYWATKSQQQRNRRINTRITAFGKTQTCAAWGEETGLGYNIVWKRIYRRKWPPERAVSEPSRRTS